MGWYTHPSTLCMAQANATADKVSHDRRSLEWLQAYRNAYHTIAGDEAKQYIQKLDTQIAGMRKPTPLELLESTLDTLVNKQGSSDERARELVLARLHLDAADASIRDRRELGQEVKKDELSRLEKARGQFSKIAA